MPYRAPRPHPLANSQARLALLVNRRGEVRTIEIRPALAICCGLAGGLLVSWLVVASFYAVFKDDVLARFFHQQTEMQFSYEDRIATLRGQIDKLASRGLLNQDSVEAKIDQLLARQVKLEARQTMIAPLAEKAGIAPAPAPAPAPPSAMVPLAPNLPGTSAYAPIGFGTKPRPLPQDTADQPASPTPAPGAGLRLGMLPDRMRATVARIGHALDETENLQEHALDRMAKAASGRISAAQDLIAAIGLPVSRFEAEAGDDADDKDIGGPFVPLPPGARFEERLGQVEAGLKQAAQLQEAVSRLPLMRPMPAGHRITSPFGSRPDPFFHRYGMHTGTDFRARAGTPVPATAPGLVTVAAYTGGYGNMVEIDHGNGIVTRYGHLSEISVAVGDKLRKGDILGRVGSTGRSTGPHLHYEVRVDGEPVDPMRFIKPGALLASR
jgi:murein DD-endopeptidase MepM/ murein hydrolase activator NlpD